MFADALRRRLDEHPDAWAPIVAAARGGDVVLLYSSHDTEHNNAVVLRDYVNERLDRPASKPANSTPGHSKHDRGR